MFQNYKTKTLKKDILSGIIVALVSIPISMGYAQVAGLPVVYGLYGSLLPILVFSLITSSPQLYLVSMQHRRHWSVRHWLHLAL